VTAKLEGFAELDRALGQLPKATAKNVLRRTLRKAAAPMLSDVQSSAPSLTGKMVAKLGEGGKLTANERKGTGPEFLGLGANGEKIFSKQSARNYVEIHIGAIGVKQNSPIPMWKEFGTFKDPAEPFFRPTWETGKQPALNSIKVDLGGEIEKAAKRYAKKIAKGAG
jgi:HK97 gp10 family phage protein